MSTRRDGLILTSRGDIETAAQRSVLARVGRVGLAMVVAFAAVMSLGTWLLIAQGAAADTHGTDISCSSPGTLLLDLEASAEVARPGEEIVYVYTVINLSTTDTLIDVVVEDTHLGPIPPTHFSLPPGESVTLTATDTLNQNRTSSAFVTAIIEGDGRTVSDGPAMVTVHVIEGISLTQAYAEPPPIRHGDVTTLYYSLVNEDQDDGVVGGIVLITDSLGRALDEALFGLDPAATLSQSSFPFTVPRDIIITLTATGWDDIRHVLPVSDQATLTLCPQDVYEPDNGLLGARRIYPNEPPQFHDFSGDDDWVWLRLSRGDWAVYTFGARPLAPDGVPISATLYHSLTPLTHTDNLVDPLVPLQISRILSCTVAEGCNYYLETESPASGCWTEYEVWVEETPAPTPLLTLPVSAQAARPGAEVIYTYTVINPSTVYTLTDVLVEDTHLGPIPPTHFSIPPGESATLTAATMVSHNRTSTATVTAVVEGDGRTVSGEPATIILHVIEGISLTQAYAEPASVYPGDVTRLHYSLVNQDQDDGVVSGTVLIADSLGRTLDEVPFELSPAATVFQSSSPFTVPQDIAITLTATGWDDVKQVLSVTDQATLTLRLQRRIWMPMFRKGS